MNFECYYSADTLVLEGFRAYKCQVKHLGNKQMAASE